MSFIEDYGVIALAVLVVLIIVQYILLISTQGKLKKLTKKYDEMINSQGVDNLESVLANIHQQVDKHEKDISTQKVLVDKLEKEQPLHKSKLAITRYNAFSDTGSDLSFSLAIVDGNKDGVVISGIHSREGGYIYGKPVEKGQSNYSLTPEELKAIEAAK